MTNQCRQRCSAIARGLAPVEGRHAAWPSVRTGAPTFSEATEPALTRDEIETALIALVG